MGAKNTMKIILLVLSAIFIQASLGCGCGGRPCCPSIFCPDGRSLERGERTASMRNLVEGLGKVLPELGLLENRESGAEGDLSMTDRDSVESFVKSMEEFGLFRHNETPRKEM